MWTKNLLKGNFVKAPDDTNFRNTRPVKAIENIPNYVKRVQTLAILYLNGYKVEMLDI